MTSTDAQMRLEIARLTASINHRKSMAQPTRPSNTYINPNYKPPASKQFTFKQPSASSSQSSLNTTTAVKDVVLGGVAFESSARSLVRKDLPKPKTTVAPKPTTEFARKSGHLVTTTRTYKPTSSRGRGIRHRNMTLTNSKRPYQNRKLSKRMKYTDKPCPRFTTTGSCNRGLTCQYQHDPSKIAICWPFLQGTCSKTAETCELSHDPTPERTPLCHHFLNKGRCTRQNCPFPHVNVGTRQGICRDFAVLGYCGKGLDCDKQHIRECPDFAENGTCTTKGCKLPHVIRANRNRKPEANASKISTTDDASASPVATDKEELTLQRSVLDAQLGDEFISLTFNESESEEGSSDEEEDDNDEDENEDEAQDVNSDEDHINED